MREKKYRIKEEVKKYFSLSMKGLERKKCYWIADGVSLEALEEVEERTKLYIISHNKLRLQKTNHTEWTEQEREDIEKFLNVFKNEDGLRQCMLEFAVHILSTKGINHNFVNGDELNKFLKEKGYDK